MTPIQSVAMMTVLVTGFEPCRGEDADASWEAVRELGRTWYLPSDPAETPVEPLATTLVTLRLPVSFDGAAAAIADAVAQHRPDVVVAVGVEPGSASLHLERVAANVMVARTPDSAGAQPAGVPVVAGGPTRYVSTLPLHETVAALAEAGVPAVVSDSAGFAVSNATFYALRHATQGTGALAGFVHVPPIGDLAAPAADVGALASALRVVVQTALAAAAGRAEVPVPGTDPP